MPKTSIPAPRLWQAVCALDQFTLLYPFTETEAVKKFREMGTALLRKDIATATRAKSVLTGLLIHPTRRISGDLWQDFLLQWLIFTPNPFQELAASGMSDPHISAAMERDLSLLQTVFACGSETLNRESAALCALMDAPAEDVIALMAGVAWGGGEIRTPQKAKTVGVTPLLFDEWGYDVAGFEAQFGCDDILAGLYCTLLSGGEWVKSMDTLALLYATYGTGDFMLYDAFTCLNGELTPRFVDSEPWDALLGIENAKNALLANTQRFFDGEAFSHVWLYGDSGMGKSALVCSLASQSALKLIHIPPDALFDPMPLLQVLSQQPLYFLLWLDDVTPGAPELKRLCQCLQAFPKPNLMLIATSRLAPQSTFFGSVHAFSAPTLKALIEIVLDMARRNGTELDYERVQDAAIDWQRAQGDLSLHSAKRLCEALAINNS